MTHRNKWTNSRKEIYHHYTAICLLIAPVKLKSDTIKCTKAITVTFELLELTKSILVN